MEKSRTLGTAACPPYHIAFVIGGTSAEATLKTVKLASTKYYDGLPGNEHGGRSAMFSRQGCWKKRVIWGSAQFGGKYFAHDVRVISAAPRRILPVGMGVSCSADRNIKANQP